MATVYSLVCFGGRTGKTVTFTDTGDVVNLTNHGLRPGTGVVFSNSGGALPTGLTAGTTYYAKQGADQNKFLLYPTSGDAIAGTNQVTFSGAGTGTHTVKSAWLLGLSDLSRYGSAGSERIYDGLVSWNSGRSGASEYDTEVCEIGEAFSDIITAAFTVNVPSAQNRIETKINGVRSDAFHAGAFPALTLDSMSLSTGYVLYNASAISSGALIKITRYRDTIDGIVVLNRASSSVGYGVDLGVQCRCYRSFIISTSATAVGTTLRGALGEFVGNVVVGWSTGALIGSSQSGIYFANNLITKCTNGFSAASSVLGFYYNNISVGNTTANWPTQPTALEGADKNAGLTGQAWVTGSGSRITIATTDFVSWGSSTPAATDDFYPAALSSPQVETGVSPYGYPEEDIAGAFRPAYNNGAATYLDVGPFEYDLGYGPWPTSDTRGLAFTGLVAGSTLKVFETGTTTELFSDTNTSTSETWSENASGSKTVDYTILKDGYVPIRVTGIMVTGAASGGVLATPIQQVASRAYQTPSGLSLGTTATINTGTKRFTVAVATTVQNWYSYMMQCWRTEMSLKNVAFPISENGPNSFQLADGWQFSSGVNYLSRDGMRYVNSSGVVTDVWAAILSVGVPAGKQVRFEQSDGGAVVSASTTGNIDELVKIYESGSFDKTGFLTLKVQGDGLDQAEFDAVATYGTLEDQLYVAGLAPTDNGIAAGTVTGVTITDHGTSPVTWNGKTFSITITDTTGHTGEQIVQYVRGLNNFNYHDLVQTNGTEFKTVRGKVYGDTGAALKGVRVVQADGTTSHTDFNYHTSDDGTAYIPPLPPAAAEVTVLADTRVQLYNVTTDTEIENVFVTGTNYSYVITTEASAGDVLRLRACKLGRIAGEAFGVWGASGVEFLISQPEDTIYTTWGIDGSTVTEFSGDVTGHIYIDANDLDGATTKTRLGAWYSWVLTTDIGIRHFYNAVTYVSSAAIRINVDVADILIENTNATTALRFTDTSVRLYRSDGSSVIAPTSYSIHNDYSGVPDVVETGVSGLTGSESAQLMGLPDATGIWSYATRTLTSGGTGSGASADDVWNHSKALSVGKFLGLK